jgi:biopolymer transport protein ExbD
MTRPVGLQQVYVARHRVETCRVDMTPLIDIVFQLIIFFTVTIDMSGRANPDIRLAKGPHGLTDSAAAGMAPFTVEVDRNGRFSVHNIRLTPDTLKQIMVARYARIGEYPVMIRGDERARHADIRRAMEVCTDIGLERVWFAAIKKIRR